jgi:enoyl-CoA hydratase/carnithine racemase
LVGDHIDAKEAHRIGLVNKVVPVDQLAGRMFQIVERIARVPPETVKINLAISTMGLQMMGLRDALHMDETLSIPAHMMLREEFRRPLTKCAPRRHESLPAKTRRPVSTGAVWTESEEEGMNRLDFDCHLD